MKTFFFKRFKTSFNKKVEAVTSQASEAINQEIEVFIDKTLSRQEIEAIIIKALEKFFIRMFRKHGLLIIGFVISLFIIQLIVLHLSIQSLKNCSIL